MAHLWAITDHACRLCLGRVLARRDKRSGDRHVRCAECGAGHIGNVDSLCACGVRFTNGRDAGLRCGCHTPTPETPQQVTVRYVTPDPPKRGLAPRPVSANITGGFAFDSLDG